MTDTPKTDAVAKAGSTCDGEVVGADFCRGIERECRSWAKRASKSEQQRREEHNLLAIIESEIEHLRSEVERLTVERDQLESLVAEQRRLAELRHSVVAAAVLETVRDRAATWDDASEELIWPTVARARI